MKNSDNGSIMDLEVRLGFISPLLDLLVVGHWEPVFSEDQVSCLSMDSNKISWNCCKGCIVYYK